jgi:hypothetical protein
MLAKQTAKPDASMAEWKRIVLARIHISLQIYLARIRMSKKRSGLRMRILARQTAKPDASMAEWKRIVLARFFAINIKKG